MVAMLAHLLHFPGDYWLPCRAFHARSYLSSALRRFLMPFFDKGAPSASCVGTPCESEKAGYGGGSLRLSRRAQAVPGRPTPNTGWSLQRRRWVGRTSPPSGSLAATRAPPAPPLAPSCPSSPPLCLRESKRQPLQWLPAMRGLLRCAVWGSPLQRPPRPVTEATPHPAPCLRDPAGLVARRVACLAAGPEPAPAPAQQPPTPHCSGAPASLRAQQAHTLHR